MYKTIHPSEYPADTVELARWLLGKVIVRRRLPAKAADSTARQAGIEMAGLILETEAYLHDDPASHSFAGLTSRNKSMFLEPGRWYVYLIYGIHHCLNLVSAPAGIGEAVLIRAMYPLLGEDQMALRRFGVRHSTDNGSGVTDLHGLLDGPGKICQAFAVDRFLDGSSSFESGNSGERGPLRLCHPGERQTNIIRDAEIMCGTRIGIKKGREFPGRFYFNVKEWISR